MDIPHIKDVLDIKGKRVLLRATLNVPLKEGVVRNDFRIQKSIETIEYLKTKGAKTIIISHIGRDPEESLDSIGSVLNQHTPILFVKDLLGATAKEVISKMENGDVILLENLRQDPREKKNDDGFAKELAGLADLYVNDDFAVSHREHASIVGVPRYLPSYTGLLFNEEVKNLTHVFHPANPAIFFLGGAKFNTKATLVRKFLEIYDAIFIGGAIANDFLKAKGHNIGRSLVSDQSINLDGLLDNEKVLLPIDVLAENNGVISTKKPEEVSDSDKIVDVGPESILGLEEIIKSAGFILWNGPLGNYENGYGAQTDQLARMIANSDALSIVGGGDTVSAISKMGLEKKFSFLSTGGGALLQFLSNETLPGIEALVQSENSATLIK